MAPLLKSNAYLRSAQSRSAMLVRNAFESSVFEGARGLKKNPSPATGQPAAVIARPKASAKKRVSKV